MRPRGKRRASTHGRRNTQVVQRGDGLRSIRPDDGRRDLFVRGTDIEIDEAEPLREGTEVSYEVKQRGNGMRAINVSLRRR